MTDNRRAQVIQKIQDSQAELTKILQSVADDPLWQPAGEEWSFRDVAAHMATVDEECFMDRVQRIASGENPHFTYYLNTGRDFSTLSLEDALQNWATNRQQIIDLVNSLSDETLALTGTHITFGTLTILDFLLEMHKHDLEHIEELKTVIENEYRASKP